MKKFFRLLMGITLLVPVAIRAGELVTKKFDILNHGTLELAIPSLWQDKLLQINDQLPPAILLIPEPGYSLDIKITVLWDIGGKPDYNQPEQIKKYVEGIKQMLLPMISDETNIEMKEIKGMAGNVGSYFTVKNKYSAPNKPQYNTQGGIAVGHLQLIFNVMTPSADDPALSQTLEILKTATARK